MRRARVALSSVDPVFRDRTAAYLGEVGYNILSVGSDWSLPARDSADLLLVDLDQEACRFDLLRRLRDTTEAAILVLSTRRDPAESAVCLEIGADDIVGKPVDLQELCARVGGILERRGIARRDLIRLENATVDLVSCRLLRHGQAPERLGPGEIVLLQAFARNPNRILSRDDLLDMAAAERLDAHDRAIDTRVARLRRKLDTSAIVTVRGHGYMFVPPFDTATTLTTVRSG